MEEEKITAWVQLAATVAVVIGLVLVIVELRQAKELAEAEIASQFSDQVLQAHQMAVGDNPAPVLAKACLQPNELTLEERLVVESYVRAWNAMASRAKSNSEYFELDWETSVRLIYQRVARYAYGREVLKEITPYMDSDLGPIAAAVIEEMPTSCANLFADGRQDDSAR